jgi:ABC-type sulfate transport system permease subunit
MSLSSDELGIVLLSLKVALTAVAFSLPLAIFVAYVLARRRFPGKMLLDAVVHLPLVLPPVVVGFALLVLFGRRGAIGAWLDAWFGIVFAFRWTGAALAAAIMGFPLMVRAIRLSFAAIDRRFETVARTLGGSPASVFFSVTLPLALPGIVTGVVRAEPRRVRRDDHIRLEYSGRDSDPAAGDLHLYPSAGRRCAGVAPFVHRGAPVARRTGCGGMAGAASARRGRA